MTLASACRRGWVVLHEQLRVLQRAAQGGAGPVCLGSNLAQYRNSPCIRRAAPMSSGMLSQPVSVGAVDGRGNELVFHSFFWF